MNYLLHRHRSPGAVVPIPEDLRPLMEEISREVLRSQPSDVIGFIADYLEEKLVRRENRRLAEKVVDNVLDYSLDIVALLEQVGIEPERAEAAVKRIHEEFQSHFETKTSDERQREVFREQKVLERLVKECNFSESEARQASAIIERAYRTFYFRNAYRDPHPPAGPGGDWRLAANHSLSLYAQSGATRQEMEVAARRIQVAYRAYYKRKRELMDQQATVIQRAFRSHRRRQESVWFGGDEGPSEIIFHEVLHPNTPSTDEAQSESSFSPLNDILRLIRNTIDKDDALEAEGSVHEQDRPTMDPDGAATLIQSVFRGHQRRKLDAPRTPRSNVLDEDAAATLLQSTFRGHLARKRRQQEETSRHHKLATLLQSHARGYLARRRLSQNPRQNS